MIAQGSVLWQYLSPSQRLLSEDGRLLVQDRQLHPEERLSDYSYLVFPFAKLYEGFLKQLFRDLGIIESREYRSDHFRIGKSLSPNLAHRLGKRSAYAQLETRYGSDFALQLWESWKEGRNLVFHYFPHNYRALSQEEAQSLIERLIKIMEEAVRITGVKPSNHEE